MLNWIAVHGYKGRDERKAPSRAAGNLSHPSATSTTVNNAVAPSRIELFYTVRRFQSMTACKTSTGIDLDYVEDSEPERKRIRFQASETKKRRIRQKQVELRRETTATIVAHGSSPSSQIPTYFHSEGLDGVTAEAIPNHVESIVIDIIGQFCTNSRLS